MAMSNRAGSEANGRVRTIKVGQRHWQRVLEMKLRETLMNYRLESQWPKKRDVTEMPFHPCLVADSTWIWISGRRTCTRLPHTICFCDT